jgi:16S rRNA (adenine1518-N6/adenine1519-N6)-dimethyltransferase
MSPFARKRFGQNFLEPAWVDKVVRAIDPQSDQTFVEIGPGRGALTRPLAARAKAVIAYEIDRDLGAQLQATAPANVSVVIGDILETFANPESRFPNPVRVTGNLPYNIASPILFHLVRLYTHGLAHGQRLTDAIVMLQREVANRLVAEPGSRDYGVLTVLIGHAAKVERLLALPPGAFRPAPKVHSAIVRLAFHPPDPPVRDTILFAKIVQAVFTRRRKTLANALLALGSDSGSDSGSDPGYRARTAEALGRARLDGSRRPETLSIAEFARLADAYASISG